MLVSGCPLPQPLPDYQRGTATVPRIVMDGIPHPETIIRVAAGCATDQAFDLSATLVDPTTTEKVIARWFVDYDAADERLRIPVGEEVIAPPPSDSTDPLSRKVGAYTFRPYSFDDAVGGITPRSAPGILHVVELVVCADFNDVDGTPPHRAPGKGFETQTYRWVFMNVPQSGTVTCQ